MVKIAVIRQEDIQKPDGLLKWFHQDLVLEAKLIAQDLVALRKNHYREQFKPFGSFRVRTPYTAKLAIKRLANRSGFSRKKIRECLVLEIEEILGKNSKVVCNRRTVKVMRF